MEDQMHAAKINFTLSKMDLLILLKQPLVPTKNYCKTTHYTPSVQLAQILIIVYSASSCYIQHDPDPGKGNILVLTAVEKHGCDG